MITRGALAPRKLSGVFLMKSAAIYLLLTLLLCMTLNTPSFAGMEFKLFGVIQKIETPPSAGGFSTTVTIRETRSDKLFTITVTDTLTLDKLRDRRIVEGDDIRCSYELVNGKNISRVLKKTVGC